MRTAEDWLLHCAGEMNQAGLFFGHGTDNANDEAAWMLLHILEAPMDGSFVNWGVELSRDQQEQLKILLARRIDERVPLAYLTGEARFCGLDFIVNPQVLVPRSPLAELIPGRFSPWLQLQAGGKVLDMCTGGGCIAVAMAVYLPDCEVDAVDVSEEALQVASQNIKRHGVGERVNLIHSDLFSAVDTGAYDLIVSNPPYVSTAVFEELPAEYLAEPSGGLLCGEDGLEIVLKIMDAAPDYLQQQGILIVEVGESAETLMGLLPRVPFLWFDFEQGGDGIFMLEYDQLIACQPDVQTVLEQRKYV